MSKLKNIIYISGSGRSGSTMFERVLNSSDQIAALGEFHCLWRLPAGEITCACGTIFPKDEFWRAVMEDAGVDQVSLVELRQLEQRIARTSFLIRHRFSLNLLRANPDVRLFLDMQFSIFESVSKLTGSPVLVDSSKAGPRAWLLACDPRTRIIHLYRDPADVVASWRSAKYDDGLKRDMKKMPVSAALLDWWKVEQLIRLLPPGRVSEVIDYRKLCTAPRTVVDDLLDGLGVEPKPKLNWIKNHVIARGNIYHSLNGNPDRFDDGPIRISLRNTEWQKIKPAERMYIRTAAGAVRILYPSR